VTFKFVSIELNRNVGETKSNYQVDNIVVNHLRL